MKAVTARLTDADAFIIVTPEYNHSYPASVKALVDWHFTQWTAKPVAFVSYGGVAGGRARCHSPGERAHRVARGDHPGRAIVPGLLHPLAGREPLDEQAREYAKTLLVQLDWRARYALDPRGRAVPGRSVSRYPSERHPRARSGLCRDPRLRDTRMNGSRNRPGHARRRRPSAIGAVQQAPYARKFSG